MSNRISRRAFLSTGAATSAVLAIDTQPGATSMTCSLSTDARMVVWPVSMEAEANVERGSIRRAGLQNPAGFDVMRLAIRSKC